VHFAIHPAADYPEEPASGWLGHLKSHRAEDGDLVTEWTARLDA